MVKPILLLSAFAMLIGVAVGQQSPSANSCKAFADLVELESKLPNEPPGMRIKKTISGETAKVAFPDHMSEMKEGKKYTYSVALGNCTFSVGSFASMIETDPRETRTMTRNSSEWEALVGFDRYLADLYWRLDDKPAKIDISRGKTAVTVPGIKIKRGDKAQLCLAAPGWKCSASVQVKERRSKKTIIDRPYDESTFFPGMQDGQPLIKGTWVVRRKKQD